ncbi:hypothetical protein BDC45DRAFT_140931 [Circinella umbellata]|nr:hypothetical protein BDC45DRAFT_140931 [Circinella umbellata]
MRRKNVFLLLCSIVLIGRFFQIQLINNKRSSDSFITTAATKSMTTTTVPLILPIVKRGLKEDYCHVYEGIFSTASKTLESATEFIDEHVDIIQDVVEDGYIWTVSRLNHAIETLWDIMMDIYLAPELEWCMFWSMLNRYFHYHHHHNQQQRNHRSNKEKNTTNKSHNDSSNDNINNNKELSKSRAVTPSLDNKKYGIAWDETVCSAPLEYGLRASQLQQEFRKLVNRAITKTRHTIQSNQVDWLHTLRGIQQAVSDAHSNILTQYNNEQEDRKLLITSMRTSRRRLKRLVRHQLTEIHMRSLRTFRRLDKAIHRLFHDAGMTPLSDTSSQVMCLDKLRQHIMDLSKKQYEHGMDRILTTGKHFGNAVMDTLETSLTAFMDDSKLKKKEDKPLNGDGYYLVGVNSTDVMVTTVPMVVYSSMKRVDADLATLVKISTDISEEMENQLCRLWEAASQKMSRSEYTWYHWFNDWWNFLKFTLWVVLKVIVSFF